MKFAILELDKKLLVNLYCFNAFPKVHGYGIGNIAEKYAKPQQDNIGETDNIWCFK